ncbi:fatty acid desaturase family protein [Zavarzinia compransoris]|uniref:Fatty acid desaturase domain-containing protein n=1 Tax=Zavarzinia compransoris TaxID=1264899 RepID=A0A317E6T8_9PROT|nr:acyl-CoA desaturase [Zavarzinia compransoris]PWR20775.1 hypothetical protein DKG75_12330 [Zavarzinia compransoris]TDP44391.1 linoleoyl-CoA desaturase [Zavarzinia compransoris]
MSGRISFQPRPANGFAAQLRPLAERLLDDPARLRRGRRLLLVKGLCFGGLAALAYGGLLSAGPSPAQAALAAVAFGLAALLLAINIGHDGAHGTLVRRRGLNHLLQFLTFVPIGVDAYLWRFRHIASHHVFPNVNGSDIDIDANAFLRLSPNQPWRGRFRFQHLYAPAVYGLVALHSTWVQDYAYLFQRDLANARDIRHPWPRYLEFALGKAIHVALWFGVPALVLPFSVAELLGLYLLGLGVMSVVFVFMLVGTHFSTAALFPVPDAEGRLGHDFAEHALVTSIDWAPASPIAGFLAGGANTHAAHHLFPRVPHVHYRALTPLIAETAGRNGLAYNRRSFPGMVADHFRFLYRMGRPVTAPPSAARPQGG